MKVVDTKHFFLCRCKDSGGHKRFVRLVVSNQLPACFPPKKFIQRVPMCVLTLSPHEAVYLWVSQKHSNSSHIYMGRNRWPWQFYKIHEAIYCKNCENCIHKILILVLKIGKIVVSISVISSVISWLRVTRYPTLLWGGGGGGGRGGRYVCYGLVRLKT